MDYSKAVMELKRGTTCSTLEQAVQTLAANPTYHAQEHATMTGRTLTESGGVTLADDGLLLTYTSDAVGTLTIPTDAVGLWTGTHVLTTYVSGAGIPAFDGAVGVTLRNADGKTAKQYGFLTAIRVGADTWAVC